MKLKTRVVTKYQVTKLHQHLVPLDLVFPTQTPEETDVETDSKINNQAVVLMEAKML